MESDCQNNQRGKNLKTKRLNFMLPDLPYGRSWKWKDQNVDRALKSFWERDVFASRIEIIQPQVVATQEKWGGNRYKKCKGTLTTFIMGLIWCQLETKCTSGTIHFKPVVLRRFVRGPACLSNLTHSLYCQSVLREAFKQKNGQKPLRLDFTFF